MFSKKIYLALIACFITTYAHAEGNPDIKKDQPVKNQSVMIDSLPEQGKVTISGTVKEVTSPKAFILSDSQGDTINVETSNAIELRKNDQVKVMGTVTDELFGIGKKIKAEKVEASPINKSIDSQLEERSQINFTESEKLSG